MSLREGYKETEIGVIPEDWEVSKLGEILNVQTGKKNAQDAVENGEYPFFTRSVDTQRIDTYSQDTEALFIAGEGNFAVKYYKGKFDIHQRTYMLTCIKDNSVDLKFLQNSIQPRIFKLVATSVGSTVQSLRKPIIENLQIPLPPLEEQKKIADILSTVDQKIDLIDTQINDTGVLKKGLMQKLLTEGIGHSEFKESEIGRIPVGWEVVKLVNAIELMTDYVANGSFASLAANVTVYDEANYAIYVRLFDLRKGLGHEAQKYVDRASYEFLNKSSLEGNEILLANIGANVGETFLMPFIDIPATLAPNMIEIKVDKRKLISEFIYFYLNSAVGLSELDKVIEGSGQPKINKTKLKTIMVPIAPLSEQKEIIEILSTTDEKLESLQEKKEAYETLKKGLMQKLLTGEVRVE